MSTFSINIFPEAGYTGVPGNICGLKYIDEFGILKLQRGETYQYSSKDNETGIMVLTGKCQVEVDGASIDLGKRDNVFHGLPEALYLPPGKSLKVSGGPVEAAICQTKATQEGKYKVIRESDVRVMQVGKGNWYREVRQIIPPKGFSQNLILGETINPPGNWSGTPPHKHEVLKLPVESINEELYYFKIDKPSGWGIQRTYSPQRGVNELIYLEDNTVTFMPWGYHQIVAAPGYTLYYLFFLAGKGNDLCGNEDPDQNWIKKD